MKYFGFLVFLPGLACAADFTTGQAARLIIGQPTFTAQSTGSPSAAQLGAVGGLAYANDTLFVVDGNRVQATPVQNRLLIYRHMSNFARNPTADIPQGVRCPVCAGGPDVKQADTVLGQPDFTTVNSGITASTFRTPTAVATDGQILAVADTDNNRVLLWKSIPQGNGTPADLVLGQVDLKTVKQPPVVDNKSFRGPQGVWIQGTRLFVADTQNHRVMVWNNIPTTNNQPADFVLGQPNFTTAPEADLTKAKVDAKPTNMLNPVSVTSDGVHLLVTDLGHNRVLVWNFIPTQTQQAADLALGQPDTTSALPNNTPALCAPTSQDSKGNNLYPERCASTLSFPRFALSDGERIFVADGGNDRILVYNALFANSGQRADVILGQPDEFTDQISDSTDTFRPDANITRSSSDSIRTPISLAWDGNNLFASDPYDRRVVVFTPGQAGVPLNGITNAASRAVFSLGTVDLAGTIKADDTVTITINGVDFKYTVVKDDTLPKIVDKLVALINAPPGNSNVYAIANPGFNEIVLSAKNPGDVGNNVTLAVATSSGATITAAASGTTLGGGQSAAKVAPGTIVTITGTNLSDTQAEGKANANGDYPRTLAGVTVYFDGIKAPVLFVSPTQVNTQVPFEVQDTSGVSAYVVTKHNDGSVTSTTAVNVPIVLQNPGIFALDGQDPRPAIAFHATSNATAVVDIDGTVKSGDTATITINGTSYTYTVQSSDTITNIRDALIGLINADASSPVTARPAGQFTRVVLSAKAAGPDGNGITVSSAASTNAQIALTALQSATCCASVAGAPVTSDNPAVPGEIITVYATGIGLVQANTTLDLGVTGSNYNGPAENSPTSPVDDAMVGGKTANVLYAGLKPGMLGVYEVQLQLSTDLLDNDKTQVFIAQNVFTSNIVTIPVRNPPSQ